MRLRPHHGFIILVSCATAGEPPPLMVDQVVSSQRLKGPEALAFEVIQSNERALVRVSGQPGPHDGLVFDCELQGDLADREYVTQIDGRDWRLLVRRKGDWVTYLPGASGVSLEEISGNVDAKSLLRTHLDQRKSGRLAEVARFDEEGARAEIQSELEDDFADAGRACGIDLQVVVDWSSLRREDLMRYSISSYCSAPAGALQRACETPEVKTYLAPRVETVRCTFEPTSRLALQDDELIHAVEFETPNRAQWARQQMDRFEVAPGRTVERARHEHAAVVCRMKNGPGIVVLGPDESEEFGGISYGRNQQLFRQPERPYLSGGWFFEPRFPNPRHNANFRGYDMRVYSKLQTEDGACTLHCGTASEELTRVEGDDKRAFFEAARFERLTDPRKAYALARDRRGRYFYVDHGATRDTEKDFRLYIGRPGRVVRQKMKDIVADSEGEIFESENGKLRLLLGKDEAEWIARGRRIKLLRIPVSENYELIYGRLGVYLGVPLQTPCDDFG
ncbi:MAG: hypothetical protein ACFB9M_20590 [Myxococcota bacterium]